MWSEWWLCVCLHREELFYQQQPLQHKNTLCCLYLKVNNRCLNDEQTNMWSFSFSILNANRCGWFSLYKSENRCLTDVQCFFSFRTQIMNTTTCYTRKIMNTQQSASHSVKTSVCVFVSWCIKSCWTLLSSDSHVWIISHNHWKWKGCIVSDMNCHVFLFLVYSWYICNMLGYSINKKHLNKTLCGNGVQSIIEWM